MNLHAQSAVPAEKGWRIWWRLTRPHTLTAAFVPVLLGTVLAAKYYPIDSLLFAAMLIASLLIQAATNMFNEYFDFARGLDTKNSVGIGGAIVRNGVKPRIVLGLGFAFLGAALLLGIYISANTSWWLAVIGLVCMAAGYFYTGGPFPIAYTPFGEITSGFFMGFVITQIAYFIQAGKIDSISILVSIPISILIGSILLANNIRDLDGDKENGRKTVAILLGREKAIQLLAAMFIISYLFILVLILFFSLSPWLLITFASIPKAASAVKGFIGKTEPIQMMPAMKATAQTNTIFGFLMAISFLISNLLK
ncbi:1,4-dihydroxy-2-naphthoate octaprenyltransferase [Siminovitchia terrae]|uniref:1,4-dihydroxy-2-naphthoate octaprenyltransferase n=1 Tax=Siminovitchia terrae TaxID=1914933 RepID=A0A429X1Q7_SIMTE|nr:1,4-dihydroxy-2-naphthoate polyprenyltransferase [Siminovitchia terrae]RST57155.1 1,4-dihydroxy-2-naphthoate polyprenyltransferase [Siminovitchia terrae]GIN93129.1 1,4-dihydroxy-2-naphthoate octaprenyltransferase [Siminovitchia terrae]GIN98864.1 1,4-dihydroxy-2-naphthoate octaprenyltransferase [Siminovitchia terrae]